jgi:hypothetical protein
MDRWTGRKIDSLTDTDTDSQKYGWSDTKGQTEGLTDKRTDGRTDGLTYIQKCRQIDA